MATIDAFRTARCYTPPTAVQVLGDSSSVPRLVLALDVDALERSARARVDRVMLLALTSLAATDTEIVLLARYEKARAASLVRRSLPGATCAAPSLTHVRAAHPGVPVILLSDDPQLFAALAPEDRGLALGRPELTSVNVCSISDVTVRALLGWLVEQRLRARAS
jgi:hypothetical protein